MVAALGGRGDDAGGGTLADGVEVDAAVYRLKSGNAADRNGLLPKTVKIVHALATELLRELCDGLLGGDGFPEDRESCSNIEAGEERSSGPIGS